MVLRTGDAGDAVKALQRDLNKLGSMLLIDGQFGTGTSQAIVEGRQALALPGPPEADDAFQAAVAATPDPIPPLTAAGLTFIARAEVSSASAYRKKYQTPCLPPPPSGITIGIGYDCQFVSRAQLEADWAGALPPAAVEQLAAVIGQVGSPDLLALVNGVVVPLVAAMTVFATRSLPAYLEKTRSIYPQVDDVPAARRTALVSLVYNRGTRLTDKDDVRQDRLEMRAIRDRLTSGDPAQIAAVADQFIAMTRLWDPAKAPGLIQRRRDEATLWREGFAALQLD